MSSSQHAAVMLSFTLRTILRLHHQKYCPVLFSNLQSFPQTPSLFLPFKSLQCPALTLTRCFTEPNTVVNQTGNYITVWLSTISVNWADSDQNPERQKRATNIWEKMCPASKEGTGHWAVGLAENAAVNFALRYASGCMSPHTENIHAFLPLKLVV